MNCEGLKWPTENNTQLCSVKPGHSAGLRLKVQAKLKMALLFNFLSLAKRFLRLTSQAAEL